MCHLTSLIRDFPRDLRTLTRKASAGKLQVNFHHRGLDDFTQEMDRASNRMAFSVIIASIVVGSSMLLATNTPPVFSLFGDKISILGLVGFVIAFLLGLRLAWAIWRSGRL